MSEYLDLSNGDVEPITEESWEAQKSVSIPSHRVKDSNFILEMFEENGDDSSEGDDVDHVALNRLRINNGACFNIQSPITLESCKVLLKTREYWLWWTHRPDRVYAPRSNPRAPLDQSA